MSEIGVVLKIVVMHGRIQAWRTEHMKNTHAYTHALGTHTEQTWNTHAHMEHTHTDTCKQIQTLTYSIYT